MVRTGLRRRAAVDFDTHPPEQLVYVESSPRHVRVLLGDTVVADSDAVLLLHPPERTPTHLFRGCTSDRAAS